MSGNAVTYVKQILEIDNDDDSSVLWIEMALKAWSITERYTVLEAQPTYAAGGVVTYLDFQTARDRQWIDNEFTLYDGDYNIIIPETVDLNAGRFTFSTEPVLPVRFSGVSYCPYNAAADILLARAGGEAGNLVSFSTQSGNFNYADPASSYRKQADYLRTRGRKSIAV